jgi:hypothetical protein
MMTSRQQSSKNSPFSLCSSYKLLGIILELFFLNYALSLLHSPSLLVILLEQGGGKWKDEGHIGVH